MRIKPTYNFERHCTPGEPLKGERHTHAMKGSSKRYSKPSRTLDGPTLQLTPKKHRGGPVRASQHRSRDEAELLFSNLFNL